MRHFSIYASIITILILSVSCTNNSESGWSNMVPSETSFIIIPPQDATVQSILTSSYIPLLEDVSSAAIQPIVEVDSLSSEPLSVKSLLLYPGPDQKLQPVWIVNNSGDLDRLLEDTYARRFTPNRYNFEGRSILNVQINNRSVFAAPLDDWVAVSESSLALENIIRTQKGLKPGINFDDVDMGAGSLIINTPALDRWVAQLSKVRYHPKTKDLFRGTAPTVLKLSEAESEREGRYQLSGSISLTEDAKSVLVASISQKNQAISLDEYISSNAAGWGIFYDTPADKLSKTLPDTSAVDDFLMTNPAEYDAIANTLKSEFAMVMYTESGFLSTGEHLFIRKLSNSERLNKKLEQLRNRGFIKKIDGLYFVQSFGLARLLGSPLCNFKDFYLDITDDAVVVSKRKGLAERIETDRNRRRIITYKPFYKEAKKRFPDQLSSVFVSGPEFTSFLTPYLSANNYVDALTSSFNYMTVTTRLEDDGSRISLNISTFNADDNNVPFRSKWIYNTNGSELSGKPVTGNVGGSYNNEVIFATQAGIVNVIAADGTLVQQYRTGSDRPIGSPVAYDWYGTGEKIVLIAAGNKIYGWDRNGDILPKFPFVLDEDITTPLTVTDLDNDRLPEAVVATADRKLHVLNGRGNDVTGWPVTTNAPIRSAPLVDYYQGQASIIAFSGNAVHAWNTTGTPISEFPMFTDATLKGSPVLFNENILGNAVDGNLYVIGQEQLFPDSLNVSNSLKREALYVSNSSLTGSPFVSSNNILTTDRNGSVFLLNAKGTLELTKSMGQASAQNWSSVITDINNDGRNDMVSLAGYGRLYAWTIETGERIFDLPKASMSHVSIADLDNDGLKELIAETDEGVQSWTIYGER